MPRNVAREPKIRVLQKCVKAGLKLMHGQMGFLVMDLLGVMMMQCVRKQIGWLAFCSNEVVPLDAAILFPFCNVHEGHDVAPLVLLSLIM